MKNKLDDIPGLGEKSIEALRRLNIYSPNDLLFHFPSNVIIKKLYQPIFSLDSGDLVVLKVNIIAMDQPRANYSLRTKVFKIYCGNETGNLQLLFFSYYHQMNSVNLYFLEY